MITQSKPQYWDKTAEEFDAIYSGKSKTPMGRWLDQWLRKDIYDRVDETVRETSLLGSNQRVLDVGTGTGRLCIPLARAGHTVVGVDFAPDMLRLATKLCDEAGVGDACTFIEGDLLNEMPDSLATYPSFDLVACLGVVDYISDLAPLFERMAGFNPKKIVVSYPKAGTFRCWLRQWRYKFQGLDCPLYFYTPPQIKTLGERFGYDQTEIKSLGELYFTVHSKSQ